MRNDTENTGSCPTCGLPTKVFLLAAPEVRCPHCREAWESTSSAPEQPRDRPLPHRSIEDLI
jgi:hypothetical protein